MAIRETLALPDGPAKTAALVAWIQGLSVRDEQVPVLVGGAAVELYTVGAYITGDLDLVGALSPSAERALRAAGFARHGRHWVHEAAQVFVEFPGSALGPGEDAAWLEVDGHRLRVIAIEDLIVDRLGSWQYWRSAVDGVNALLLWRTARLPIDLARLEQQVERAGWTLAWRSLREHAERWQDELPSEEVERWASRGP